MPFLSSGWRERARPFAVKSAYLVAIEVGPSIGEAKPVWAVNGARDAVRAVHDRRGARSRRRTPRNRAPPRPR
jgi:hypothetical protein